MRRTRRREPRPRRKSSLSPKCPITCSTACSGRRTRAGTTLRPRLKRLSSARVGRRVAGVSTKATCPAFRDRPTSSSEAKRKTSRTPTGRRPTNRLAPNTTAQSGIAAAYTGVSTALEVNTDTTADSRIDSARKQAVLSRDSRPPLIRLGRRRT